MANNAIRAVAFDMGGTLEDIYHDDEIRRAAAEGLRTLLAARGLDPGLTVDELKALVLRGMKAYGAWRERSEWELPPDRVWKDYVFAGCEIANGASPGSLAECAEELTFYYETHFHVRRLRPDVPAMLADLSSRGLRLAIISNVISRGIVHSRLAEYGIACYFVPLGSGPVLTSAEFGWRKPNERIFLEAARRLGLQPAECAYVGDTVSRDVCGARRSGYGLAIQIKSFLTALSDKETDVEPPDAVVTDLSEVVNLVTRG